MVRIIENMPSRHGLSDAVVDKKDRDVDKGEVRSRASGRGLQTFGKPESQYYAQDTDQDARGHIQEKHGEITNP